MVISLSRNAPSAVAPTADGGVADTGGRRARSVVSLAARVILVLALVTIAVGHLLGFRAQAVLSGSMQPTLHVGDLVISRPVHVDQLRPGDIVTFGDGTRGDATTTHRVVSVTPSDGKLRVVTKGDANRTTERWMAARDGSVGVSVWHGRHLGRVLMFFGQSWVRPVLITLLALLALGWLLGRIWRRDLTRSETAGP